MEPFEHLWNPHSKLSNIASDEIMKKKKKNINYTISLLHGP